MFGGFVLILYEMIAIFFFLALGKSVPVEGRDFLMFYHPKKVLHQFSKVVVSLDRHVPAYS